jgi:hypothetical protein
MPKKPPQDKKSIPKTRSRRDLRHLAGRNRIAPQSLAGIMKSGALLQGLDAKREQRQLWLDWLREALPKELGAAVVGAVARGEVLTVHAASAAWASRLRFALPGLADRVRERAPQIVTLQVRVAPAGRAGL